MHRPHRPPRHPLSSPDAAARRRDDGSGPDATSERRRSPLPLLIGLGAAAATVGGLLAARRLGRDVPPLYRSLRAKTRELPWGEHQVVTYEAGEADAEPVVFVHGVHPTASAREWEAAFDHLRSDHRVLALDLLGFGASSRPDLDYEPRLYMSLLRDFLWRAVGEPAHVVASGLSAAWALQVASEEPDLFRSLVLVNPVGLLHHAERQDGKGELVQNLLGSSIFGEALFNLMVSRPALRFWASRLYRSPSSDQAETAIDHGYQTAHQQNARFAPAAYLGDALAWNTYMALRTLAVPTLAVWGEHDPTIDLTSEREALAGVAPDVVSRVIADGGAQPHEEQPETFSRLLDEWLEERSGRGDD